MPAPDRAELRVHGDTAVQNTVLPLFAVATWLMTAGAAALAASVSAAGAWIFVAVVALLAVVTTARAVSAALHTNKFGASHVDLEDRPEVGRTLSGVADLGVALPADAVVTITVQCHTTVARTRVDKYGNTKKSASTGLRWEGRAEVPEGTTVPLDGRTQIPFSVRLPADVPRTQPPLEGMRIGAVDWRLVIAIPLPGLDFHDTFALVVH